LSLYTSRNADRRGAAVSAGGNAGTQMLTALLTFDECVSYRALYLNVFFLDEPFLSSSMST